MIGFRRWVHLGILSLVLCGCKGPPVPQELAQAEVQEHDLWKMGGPLYAPQEYQRYALALRRAKDDLIRERSRFFLARDYGQVQAELQALLRDGEKLRLETERQKSARATAVANQIGIAQAKIEHLGRLASMINEGYLARKHLTKADLALIEAERLYQKGAFDTAQDSLNRLQGYLGDAERALAPILTRYTGHAQIAAWRRMVEETIAESRQRESLAIVVSKLDRRLTVYRSGRLVKTYPVAIGRAGSSLKRYAGDRATPEGKYSIIQKRPTSAYYKALLINYPNDEDRRKFSAAKVNGSIPRSVGIGGLVEIHGGGKDGMTYGCIALENQHIAEIFDLVDVGTRVTIVGSTDYRNSISSAVDGS